MCGSKFPKKCYEAFKNKGFLGKTALVLVGLAIGAMFAFLFGLFVMILWNWLMPVIFGLPKISYFQAWGLVVLSHLLFKGGCGPHDSHHSKKKSEWKEKLKEKIKEKKKFCNDKNEASAEEI